MTVRETLAFSTRCQGIGSRYEMLAELSIRERDAKIKHDPNLDIYMKAAATKGIEASVVTDYTLKVYPECPSIGVRHMCNTMVGDQMIRGISGGEKKRVTTGEMIIVSSLKQFIHILEGTAVIFLLQPALETYDLFDDIILLTDGKIVYQGPREHVLEYFESMGFKCPTRKGVVDFLQEDPDLENLGIKSLVEGSWKSRIDIEGFVTRVEGFDLEGFLEVRFVEVHVTNNTSKVLKFLSCRERKKKEHIREKVQGLEYQVNSQKVKCFKQLGVKQVGFKQLGPGVETGVHGVQDEKRVWFEVELQGAQGNREAEVFQVSNDDTCHTLKIEQQWNVAQRRLEDNKPNEKTNTDCLVKEQEKKYQTRWKIKTGNVLDSCNRRSTQQCMKSGVAKHLGVAGIQQQNGSVNETNVTLFAKVCCFLIQPVLSKVFWAEDTTMSTYLVNRSPSSTSGFKTPIDMLGFFGWPASIKQGMLEPVKVKNMGFNESGEYKKTFIGSGVDVYMLSNGCKKCSNDSDVYYWQYTPGMFIHLFLYIDDMVFLVDARLRSGLPRVCWIKKREMYLGHSILSLKGSLSWECDVEKNGKWSCIYAVGSQENQMVYTRLDIAYEDVGMLDKFDRGLQTDIHVFVDFDNVMGRSITVMGRSTTRYGLMIQGCAGSWEAIMLHMMAFSPTEAGYMTLTEAAKEAIWLKGLTIESGFELKIVAGIAIGALSKAIPGLRFQHRLNLMSIGIA
ncbi:zinc finger, CCHC-type containing protein [Tanacetum coccineum]